MLDVRDCEVIMSHSEWHGGAVLSNCRKPSLIMSPSYSLCGSYHSLFLSGFSKGSCVLWFKYKQKKSFFKDKWLNK